MTKGKIYFRNCVVLNTASIKLIFTLVCLKFVSLFHLRIILLMDVNAHCKENRTLQLNESMVISAVLNLIRKSSRTKGRRFCQCPEHGWHVC